MFEEEDFAIEYVAFFFFFFFTSIMLFFIFFTWSNIIQKIYI